MNSEPTISSGFKVAVWTIAGAFGTVLLLVWLCGCANHQPSPPMPPMPPGAAPVVSMRQNSLITPNGFVRTTTYTWQCTASNLWDTGLRGTNYLMQPFTNAPVVYESIAQISNSFAMTTTDQSFFVIAFNTNLNTNL